MPKVLCRTHCTKCDHQMTGWLEWKQKLRTLRMTSEIEEEMDELERPWWLKCPEEGT